MLSASSSSPCFPPVLVFLVQCRWRDSLCTVRACCQQAEQITSLLGKLPLPLWPWLLEEHPWLQLGLGCFSYFGLRSCSSPVAVAEAMSSQVKLVQSSISALSAAVCLLLSYDVIHLGSEMFSGGFYAAFQLAEQFRICCTGFFLECLGSVSWRGSQPRSSSSSPSGA